MKPPEGCVSIRAAAHIAGVSRATIRRRVKEGQIAAQVKAGVLFPVESAVRGFYAAAPVGLEESHD